jgi:hypothetical protein
MMEYKQRFDKGIEKRRTTEYCRLEARKYRLKKEYDANWNSMTAEQKLKARLCKKQLDMQMMTTPVSDPFDPNFERLFYIRYADDWLCGIIGSKKKGS